MMPTRSAASQASAPGRHSSAGHRIGRGAMPAAAAAAVPGEIERRSAARTSNGCRRSRRSRPRPPARSRCGTAAPRRPARPERRPAGRDTPRPQAAAAVSCGPCRSGGRPFDQPDQAGASVASQAWPRSTAARAAAPSPGWRPCQHLGDRRAPWRPRRRPPAGRARARRARPRRPAARQPPGGPSPSPPAPCSGCRGRSGAAPPPRRHAPT